MRRAGVSWVARIVGRCARCESLSVVLEPEALGVSRLVCLLCGRDRYVGPSNVERPSVY